MARAIKEQTLYVERGNWKSGGRTVREAFDYYERELFYDHFHTHPNLNPARTAHIHSSKEHAMQTIIDFLKIIAALAIIAAVSYYWFTEGPPPRGKGRWRSVLNALSDRRTRRR